MLYSAFDEAIWDWGLHKVDPWSAKHQMGSLETYPQALPTDLTFCLLVVVLIRRFKSLAIPVFPNKNNGSHLGGIQEVIGDAYFISSGCPIEAHTSRLKTDVQWLSVVLHFLCTSVIVSKQKPGGYDD